MTVTVSIGLTSWMQSVCLVAVVQAFLFDTQPATLFPGLESDVAAPWQPVKITSLEKNKKQSYNFFLLHNILKVIFFPGAIDNQFSS